MMSKLDSYLQRKAGVLAERRHDFRQKPEAATISLTAVSKVAGITGARPTRVGDFSILTDAAPGLAGHALGPSAPELTLAALASCLVHTYLIQAALMNLPLDHVEIEASARVELAGVVGLPYEQPPQMRDFTYRARIESSASPAEIERMHQAVEQTCPVLNTLRSPVNVTRVADRGTD
ncbi:MAG: OsmC family protein [Chloroflexi bacterium]|nr:OsmC family protein [Chloroflexota bacterium]